MTDAADTETLLRIIQSVPSPKAEPIKQWLARVGAQRLDTMTRPIDAAQARTEAQTITSPGPDGSMLDWIAYHEQMLKLLRRQFSVETQLAATNEQLDQHKEQLADHTERLDDHDAQLDVLHSWVGHLEKEQRILPELLERLGPQTLTPTHQAKVKALAVRLHELNGWAFPKIYGQLNEHFQAGKYSDIPDARWEEVETWLQARIDNAAHPKQ